MRNKLFISTFLLLSMAFLLELSAQSAICSYKYRKRISFDPARVMTTSDIPNYTALIKINSDNDLRHTASGGDVENTNGYDIIFTLDDGVTKLDHRIEKYTSTTGEFIAWVRIPSLSTTYSTNIYMYYGATVATDPSLSTTFNSVYRNAYFFHSDYADKSQAGNNGTNNGFAAATTGTIANYIASNNVNDYVAIGTNGWSATAGTYEVWINSTGAWNAVEGYFLGHTTVPAYNNRIQIYGYNGRLRVGLGNSHAIPGSSPDLFTFATNRWYHVAVVYSSGSHSVYVNGASVYTGTYTGLTTLNTSADVANDGNPAAHNECMAAGAVDNMFIQNVARDANWIATSYNNQSSPSTFYSISAEPKVWTGGTNTNYNAASNWLNNSPPSAGEDVIINNGTNQPTLQGNEQVASLWIKSSATLSLGNNSLSVRYDITNCGTLSNNTGSVVCNSTSAFTQIQHFSGSGTFNLKSLHVNNTHTASPSLSLSAAATINGTLHLTNGLLYTTATNILSLSNTAVSTSGSAASFVSGPMRKTGNTAFVFPVGKGTRWRRCEVSNISASDTYTAEYFNTAFSNTTPCNAPVTNVSLVEYWQVNRAGTGNAQLRLYWEDAAASGIVNCAQLTIARWNGASWDERPGTTSGLCTGNNVGSIITTAQLTAFSPFTFGSKLFSNPLPVSLLNFTATPINRNKVFIEWSTASETNNDHFEVERTTDGVNFELVGKQKGKGNPNKASAYSTYDNGPHKGKSYYRLKQVDLNGEESLSPLVQVNLDENPGAELNYNVYPNPNTGEFTIEGDIEGAQITIYNTLGQKINYTIRSQTSSDLQIDCSAYPVGVYFIHLKLQDETKIRKLVIE